MKVRLKVFRGRSGDRRYDEFEMEVDSESSVLDCLEVVRTSLDPSLVYGRACHHGVCGACAMRINGVEKLACLTKVKEAMTSGIVIVEPLSGFEVVRDLVVDPSTMFSKLLVVKGPMLMKEGGVRRLDECVECAACYSACPVYRAFKNFLGPSAMHFAAKAPDSYMIIEKEISLDGYWMCLTCGMCQHTCPYGVDVPGNVRELRKLSVRAARDD